MSVERRIGRPHPSNFFLVRLTREFPRIENRDSVEEFKEGLGMSIEQRGRMGSKLLFILE